MTFDLPRHTPLTNVCVGAFSCSSENAGELKVCALLPQKAGVLKFGNLRMVF